MFKGNGKQHQGNSPSCDGMLTVDDAIKVIKTFISPPCLRERHVGLLMNRSSRMAECHLLFTRTPTPHDALL